MIGQSSLQSLSLRCAHLHNMAARLKLKLTLVRLCLVALSGLAILRYTQVAHSLNYETIHIQDKEKQSNRDYYAGNEVNSAGGEENPEGSGSGRTPVGLQTWGVKRGEPSDTYFDLFKDRKAPVINSDNAKDKLPWMVLRGETAERYLFRQNMASSDSDVTKDNFKALNDSEQTALLASEMEFMSNIIKANRSGTGQIIVHPYIEKNTEDDIDTPMKESRPDSNVLKETNYTKKEANKDDIPNFSCSTTAKLINPEKGFGIEEYFDSSPYLYPSLNFAFERLYLNKISKILKSEFVQELQCLVRKIPSKRIVLIAGSKNYEEDVFNWITAAVFYVNPPIENILVMSFDKEFQKNLNQRGFYPLYINITGDIITPRVKFRSAKQTIWVARMVIWRIFHYVGFKIVDNFDADAIPLKNPLKVFDEIKSADMIAATGIYPIDIGRLHGFTLNMGSLELRNSKRMNQFWDVIARQSIFSVPDDQHLINNALHAEGLTWKIENRYNFTNYNDSAIMSDSVRGVTRNGFVAVALSAKQFCRDTCAKNNKYVVVSHSKDILYRYLDPGFMNDTEIPGLSGLNWLAHHRINETVVEVIHTDDRNYDTES